MLTSPPVRRLILWDLDGTLCPHNDRFHHEVPLAVAQAARALGAGISMPEATALARQNYPGQRAAILAFSQTFGLDEGLLFRTYYAHLPDDFLSPDPKLTGAFQNNRDLYIHGVLTHAPEGWAEKALKKRNLWDFFTPGLVFGSGRLGGCLKTDPEAQKTVLAACREAGYHPETMVLVDDRKPVLEALQGIAETRVWITQERGGAPEKTLCLSSPIEVFGLKEEGKGVFITI